VYDSEDKKIGTVSQVYLDDETGRPSFVTVNLGLFGTRETFIPVDAAQPADGNLTVPFPKAFIKDAPSVEADEQITPAEEEELFHYYASGTRANAPEARTAGDGTAGERVRDQEERIAAQGSPDVDAPGAGRPGRHAEVDGEGTMVAHEERLRVGTEQQEAGRARLRKRVRTETENIEVPVRREELVVEREPIAAESAEARSAGSIGEGVEDDEVVTLKEERPVVEKETVATEKVDVGKRAVQDTEAVTADLRKEEIDVDQDDDLRR
jgi:uncharacterized protein (TIGR02271 family)